jgi:hypothetical protein
MSRGLGVAAGALALALVVGCAARHAGEAGMASSLGSGGAPRGDPAPPAWQRATGAFEVDGRIIAGSPSRRVRLRFYVAAPDRFRVEARGSVGGIALVATGSGGRVRIVLPGKRLYAEGTLDADLGTDLIGIPLNGCDLAMVMRISSGLARFRPCLSESAAEGEANSEPTGPTDRPGLIVDSSVSGEELVRFAWDWRDPGDFPREARIEMLGDSGTTTFALTRFRALPFPGSSAGDFFWEPIPAGATLTSFGALAGEGAP